MARPNEDGKIVCTGCERELPGDAEHFHRHRDAFKPKCKECRGSSFGVHSPNKVYDAKDGHKFCSSCNEELPATDEYFFNGGKDENGLTSQCKQCQSGSEYGTSRPNYQREDGMWKCKSCAEVYERTTENFYTSGDNERDGRCNDGLMVQCKSCHTKRANESRRQSENEVESDLSVEMWDSIRQSFDNKCAYCGVEPDSMERDHVVPLSNEGDTVPENIVPACQSCNRSKGSKSLSEWYPKQEFYKKKRERKIVNITYDRLRY
jgi:5-methylcytosine-specific restriction endonuclease McrA